MGAIRELRPVGQLLATLAEENIRVILIGMSAAIVQGVMATTMDVDLWIDLPSRQYMRVQNLARKHGATFGANTVAYLKDGTPINFVFEVTGLQSFSREMRHTRKLNFHGFRVPVLKLERIKKSKEAIRRDKDLLHIIHIRDFLRCKRALRSRRQTSRK